MSDFTGYFERSDFQILTWIYRNFIEVDAILNNWNEEKGRNSPCLLKHFGQLSSIEIRKRRNINLLVSYCCHPVTEDAIVDVKFINLRLLILKAFSLRALPGRSFDLFLLGTTSRSKSVYNRVITSFIWYIQKLSWREVYCTFI